MAIAFLHSNDQWMFALGQDVEITVVPAEAGIELIKIPGLRVAPASAEAAPALGESSASSE